MTALAWVFIVLAGFATLISVLQNIMITVMFPAAEMQAATEQAKNDQRVPWLAQFMFQNVRLLFFAFFVLASATLVSAVGLLKRKNWARLLFVALMTLGILWNVAASILTIVFFSSMPPVPATAPNEFGDQFELMSRIMIGFNIVLAAGFTVLFGWIIKRLVSAEIRQEFP